MTQWRIVTVAVLLLVTACGMNDMGDAVHRNSDGVWTGAPVADPENICYATVFDYEEGYDWRADSEKGTARCSLVLFAGGRPVLKMPVGESYEVSSDPACHKVIAGDLYSDFSDGRTTVMKRNGKEIYRYPDAESVERILVHNGQIHTLCRPKDGTGFTYRINGELRLERSAGDFFDHISSHEDTVTFFFSQPVTSAGGVGTAYYRVRNGTVGKMDMKDIVKVWDICAYDGRTCMIVTFADDKAPVMVCGDKKDKVNYFRNLNILYCRFLDSERVCANLRCLHAGANFMTDFLWLEDAGYESYRFAEALSCVYVDSSRTYAAINPYEGRDGLIFHGTTVYDMPQGYHTRGREVMVSAEDVLYVALASVSGGKPLMWINGRTDTLNVNGYIASLAVHKS